MVEGGEKLPIGVLFRLVRSEARRGARAGKLTHCKKRVVKSYIVGLLTESEIVLKHFRS